MPPFATYTIERSLRARGSRRREGSFILFIPRRCLCRIQAIRINRIGKHVWLWLFERSLRMKISIAAVVLMLFSISALAAEPLRAFELRAESPQFWKLVAQNAKLST